MINVAVEETMAAATMSAREITELRARRLAAAVQWARGRSPLFRELYRDLPDEVTDPTLLPITDKRSLMARFDDWVTDPEITERAITAFVDDLSLVGDSFLDKYVVTTTSGTSGFRGCFVHDETDFAIVNALGTRNHWTNVTQGRPGRTAVVAATGGHFALNALMTAFKRMQPELAEFIRMISVHTPLPALVAELNEFQPKYLTGYSTVISLLATEAEEGRLRIAPAAITIGGEGLTDTDRARVSTAFNAPMTNVYACNEAMQITFTCGQGVQHLNADWVILEPVDADLRPTPDGEHSHSVLLTTLYSRPQPILRYNLGDSVSLRPSDCQCGSAMPMLRVRGRATDAATFPSVDGKATTIPPMLFETLFERITGIDLAQVVQTTPTRLHTRLLLSPRADAEVVWTAALDALTAMMREHGLGNVDVVRSAEAPEQSTGGKYRTVIPLKGI